MRKQLADNSAATKKEKDNVMKAINHLLAAAAVTLGVTLTAQAGNTLMSPKAKEQARSQRSVVTTGSGSIDRSIKPISPRYAEYQHSLRRVQTTGVNIDLVHAKRPMISPKDPHYQTVLVENAVEEFQVAPLK